jgi:hypothetical protein
MGDGDRAAGGRQKMARVNVDETEWLDFRVLAMRKGRSIADYLGQLVRRELKRARRREARHPEAMTEPAEVEAPRRAAKTSRPRVRLADVELLSWRNGGGEQRD